MSKSKCSYLSILFVSHHGVVAFKHWLNYILFFIPQGYEPFFVNATAGTTVLGAYDPLSEIADICKTRGLWLHVDGAWGGSAAVSKKYRHLMEGIEK